MLITNEEYEEYKQLCEQHMEYLAMYSLPVWQKKFLDKTEYPKNLLTSKVVHLTKILVSKTTKSIEDLRKDLPKKYPQFDALNIFTSGSYFVIQGIFDPSEEQIKKANEFFKDFSKIFSLSEKYHATRTAIQEWKIYKRLEAKYKELDEEYTNYAKNIKFPY